jgi:signal transduction histidine kinase
MEYDKIFNSLPGCYLIIHPDPGFKILDANEAYLRTTRFTSAIIGKPLFEAFPENPDHPDSTGAKMLNESLLNVMATCQPHSMGIVRYDTMNEETGAFEIKYWRPVNIPVLSSTGELKCIVNSVQDVTDLVLLRKDLQQQDVSTQRQIMDAVHTTQEMERLEISSELHDNINQILNTARLFLESGLHQQPPDENRVKAGHALVEQAMDEVKKLTTGLTTLSEKEEHLTHTLETLLQQVMELKNINVVKTINLPDETLIEAKVKSSVLRIIQEQLANVVKHSHAQNLFFDLSFQNKQLKLTIKDDGRGFDAAQRYKGMGLKFIKTRVALIDGEVSISSAPGDGCQILVHIPMGD